MSAPTFNKYRSTTIYGNLSVRDLTNQAGTSVVEVASVDLSGNFLSRGDSTFTKKVICNASVGDINANNVLTTKEYVDNVVSTGGAVSLTGTNNFTGFNTYNTNFPTSTLPTSTSITNDSIVNKGMLDTIYQTISGMSSYLTTATASSTYQTIADMTNYLTTATASSTYQTIAGMTNYLTTATASSTYQTIAGMSSYLTTATANSTFASLTGTNAFSGTNSFNTNLPTSNLTPSSSTQLVTKAYVDSISGGASLSGNNTFTGINTFNNRVASNFSIIGGDNSTLTLPSVVLYNISCNSASYDKINPTGSSTTNVSQILIDNFTLPANHIKPLTIQIPVSLTFSSTLTTANTNQNIRADFTISDYYYDIYINNTLIQSVLATEEYTLSKLCYCSFNTTAVVTNVTQTTNHFFNMFNLNDYELPVSSTTQTLKVVFRLVLNASVYKTTGDGGNIFFVVNPTININSTTIWRSTSSGTAPLPTITQEPYNAVTNSTNSTSLIFASAQPAFITVGTKFYFTRTSILYDQFTVTSRLVSTFFRTNITGFQISSQRIYFSTHSNGSYSFTLYDVTANNNNMNYMGSLQYQYLLPIYDAIPMTPDHLGYVYNNPTWITVSNSTTAVVAQMKVPTTKSKFALWLIECSVGILLQNLSLTSNNFTGILRFNNSQFTGIQNSTVGLSETVYIPPNSSAGFRLMKTISGRPTPSEFIEVNFLTNTSPNTFTFASSQANDI